jgi:hypothetical protein
MGLVTQEPGHPSGRSISGGRLEGDFPIAQLLRRKTKARNPEKMSL